MQLLLKEMCDAKKGQKKLDECFIPFLLLSVLYVNRHINM